MNKISRVLIAFVAMVLLLSALGCGSSSRDGLYGKWELKDQASNTTMIFEFKQDGILSLSIPDVNTVAIQYQFVDDDTIKLIGADFLGGGESNMDFKIEGDQLTLTFEGQPEVLTRVK